LKRYWTNEEVSYQYLNLGLKTQNTCQRVRSKCQTV